MAKTNAIFNGCGGIEFDGVVFNQASFGITSTSLTPFKDELGEYFKIYGSDEKFYLNNPSGKAE